MKYKPIHLVIAIVLVYIVLNYIGFVDALMSTLQIGPTMTWSYYCVDQEQHACAIDSPNNITSGSYFIFDSSQPFQDKEGNWAVNGTLNGELKILKEGDEYVVNDNFKIKVKEIWIGMVGEQIWGDFKVTYDFYIDVDQISAEFENPSPLVDFQEEHKETILITNNILDFDGGFLINKQSETFYTGMEGWMEHSNDGIPKGLSEAELWFPIWELGDIQFKVIPYINFTSTKTYAEEGCEPDEYDDCMREITTLTRYITSQSIAEKTTRTLVGAEDPTVLITIQRNQWMEQFPQLYYEGILIKSLNIQEPVLTTEEDIPPDETDKKISGWGVALVLIILGLGAIISILYVFKPKYLPKFLRRKRK